MVREPLGSSLEMVRSSAVFQATPPSLPPPASATCHLPPAPRGQVCAFTFVSGTIGAIHTPAGPEIARIWAGVQNLQSNLFSIASSLLFAAGLELMRRYFLNVSWRLVHIVSQARAAVGPVRSSRPRPRCCRAPRPRGSSSALPSTRRSRCSPSSASCAIRREMRSPAALARSPGASRPISRRISRPSRAVLLPRRRDRRRPPQRGALHRGDARDRRARAARL